MMLCGAHAVLGVEDARIARKCGNEMVLVEAGKQGLPYCNI